LARYAFARRPWFFQNCNFLIDKFHQRSHKDGCSPAFEVKRVPALVCRYFLLPRLV
jgi:hypothetical protein